MSKFDHIAKSQKVDAITPRPFELYQIAMPNGEYPVLYVLPATEDNKPYTERALAHLAPRANRRKASPKVMLRLNQELRAFDRIQYPLHIIQGWDNVCDGNGVPVEFSKEEAAAFIAVLPDHIFDLVRDFCSDISNFTATWNPDDREKVAKK